MLMQYRIDNNVKNKLYTLFDIILILFSHFFTLIAFSRAGVVCILLLDICLLMNLKNIKIVFPILLFVSLCVAAALILNPGFIERRLAVRDHAQFTPDGMVHQDGVIDRVVMPLKYLHGLKFLYGIGPAGADREQLSKGALSKHRRTIEVHNMFGDVLRSYGLIGLLLFGYWYLRLFWNSRRIKYGFWVMAVIFAFNNAHQGIRFRFFWIFMAFLIVLINLKNEKDTLNQQSTP